jgi:hypothetical protein
MSGGGAAGADARHPPPEPSGVPGRPNLRRHLRLNLEYRQGWRRGGRSARRSTRDGPRERSAGASAGSLLGRGVLGRPAQRSHFGRARCLPPPGRTKNAGNLGVVGVAGRARLARQIADSLQLAGKQSLARRRPPMATVSVPRRFHGRPTRAARRRPQRLSFFFTFFSMEYRPCRRGLALRAAPLLFTVPHPRRARGGRDRVTAYAAAQDRYSLYITDINIYRSRHLTRVSCVWCAREGASWGRTPTTQPSHRQGSTRLSASHTIAHVLTLP